jgi:Flp pilus assembly protein TadG
MRLAQIPGIQHGRRSRKAASAVEMAIISPIVLLFILAAMDFARVMWAYGTVSEAARAGARYAMVHGSMAATQAGPAADDANVNTVVTNNAYALDTTKLTVHSTWGESSNQANCPVTVTVTYPCQLFIGGLCGLSSVTVAGSTTMIITH